MSLHELIIETENLSKSYGDVTALKSLSLKVPKNSIFGFLGPNGAGKTTTIKLLLGLAHPTGGNGKVFNEEIEGKSIEIRKRVGYLAQNPVFYDHMTARQTLHYKLDFFFDGPKDLLEKRIEETLKLVGLEGKADRPIKGFSGGERQRLGIALAQVTYPDLLILDEPAANLDPMGRRDVLEIMEKLRKHATIFYSTHILDDVQKVSDTVAILNNGELVAQAPIEELLSGNKSMVYKITMKGVNEKAHKMVMDQPWVSGIEVFEKNGHTQWLVSISDDETAEAELLRLLLSIDEVRVTDFGKDKVELEDVFMKLVEAANNGN
ncbi:ABC transporter ATP-binding protein [Candidatus Bathyarchaeota archaeon]|jgi:ABC-2 type transport system ATP-binding protein|nr:MAG: ABC transporter ATP-binding protein [Candidatus Bathyarchaeota archaeon]